MRASGRDCGRARRRLARPLAFAALLAGALPAAPRPPAGIVLAADAKARWVPFELTAGNQIRFQMHVDGRPVSALLDTGVSHSVLSRRFARAHRIRILPRGRATAIGGAVEIGWARTREVRIGGATRTGGGLTVATLPASATGLATGGAAPVDMLVGRDLTGAHALDIDYAQRRFRLLASGSLPFEGASAPLAISRDRLVYVGELTLGPARLRPVVVDTGDGSAVTVTGAGWRAGGIDVPTTTAISYGLAGPVVAAIGIVPELRTGALVARNVEVRIEEANGFSDAIGAAGRIGTGFLQKYRVLLDPAAGRMVLQAGPDADAPPMRSTSGLLLGIGRDRLTVLHVMRGGPAQAGGWKAGDTICAIDGRPVAADYADDPVSGWPAGEPGRTLALRMCDGTTRRLTLRIFY